MPKTLFEGSRKADFPPESSVERTQTAEAISDHHQADWRLLCDSNPRILATYAATPPWAKADYRLAMLGRSRRAAIRIHCLECVGYVRAEVEACTADACPLYPYRPYQ